MNTEDYVSFGCAKLLKKKGFREKVTAVYCHEYEGDDGWRLRTGYMADDYNHNEWLNISAPTLYQAAKWLRSLRLHILVDFDNVTDGWYYKVFPIAGCCLNEGKGLYPNYESALSAGIEATLKLI